MKHELQIWKHIKKQQQNNTRMRKAKWNGGCKKKSIKKRHRENEKSWKIN